MSSKKSDDCDDDDKKRGKDHDSNDRSGATNGDDVLIGTSRNDDIDGRSGNDSISGGAGNDKLRGASGNDTIDGGSGNDDLSGGDGNDLLWGGTGNDRIDGDSGNDTIDGGSGNDDLSGGSGNDLLHGGAGNDKIGGDSGNDTIDGGSGNDDLSGGSGNDTLTGGTGNDKLDGGSGLDVAVYSGNYADYRIWTKGSGRDRDCDDDDRGTMTVQDRRPGSPDGTDSLTGVEILRFADGEYRAGRFIPNGTAAVIGDPSVSEVTEDIGVAGGSIAISGTISISDADPGQAAFQTLVTAAAGNLGNLVLQSDGSYTYTVSNSAVQYLGEGQSKTEGFTVRSVDGTSKLVELIIHGANDAAIIGGTLAGSVIEAGGIGNANAGVPTASGSLTSLDIDNPSNLFQAVTHGTSDQGIGTFSLSAAGVWTYTLNNADETVQALGEAEVIEDSFTILSADGTEQVISVIVNGSNDSPVIDSLTPLAFADTEAKDSFAAVFGQVTASDADADAQLTFAVSGGVASAAMAGYDLAASGQYGTLFLNSATGEYRFSPNSLTINALAIGESDNETFALSVLDDTGAASSQSLAVEVQGANDAAIISGVTGPLQYTVGQSAPAPVAPALVLGDADSGLVTGAVVAITSGFRAGNDMLGFDAGGSGIAGSYDTQTGILTLTGSATLAEYQTVLNSVTFSTNTIGGRTIAFTVYDGLVASITVDTSSIQLENLTTNGFRISGADAYANAGGAIDTAGDINGDGFSDLIIGAPMASANGLLYAGRSYIVFGGPEGSLSDVSLEDPDGIRVSSLSGVAAYDISGFSVSSAGDVNGDGFGDVIIGATYAEPNGFASGTAYVVFGSGSGFDADVLLADLDGNNGFSLLGAVSGDNAGISVSGAGDVNGDGFADVLVGSYSDPSGAGYLIFGKASGFDPSISLDALDGVDGVRFAGEQAGNNAGQRLGAAGDVNGDGFADFIIAAPGSFSGGYGIGANYVVFGKPEYFAAPVLGATFSLADLVSDPDGTHGFRILGLEEDNGTGFGISSAGDVNGDGFDDIVMGAHSATVGGAKTGAAYVIFGKANGFARDIDLTTLDGSNGFRVVGATADSMTGYSVSAAGDFNGDGYDDLIIGAPGIYGSSSWSGESYLVFGKAGGFGADLDLATLGGADGLSVSGIANGDASGYNVSAAGDMDGDGFDDIAVSSARASPGDVPQAGETYVIFGAKLVVGGETFLGDETNNLLTGTAANETFIGGQGNDTIVGNGGNDAFSAGSGDDVIRLGAAGSPLLEFIKIKGGSGFDTLALEGSDVGLDFSLPIANRIDGIERIDLTGSGNNTLILGLQDLLGLSDTTNSLFVTGDSGDGVVSSAGWMPDGQTTFEGVDYNSYYLPGTTANLLIDLQLMASSSIT